MATAASQKTDQSKPKLPEDNVDSQAISSATTSVRCAEDGTEKVRELRDLKPSAKKAISRSRSDLNKRFSNSSDLSELGLKCSRNSADLEKFFNEMGLDRSVLDPALHLHAFNQSTSSLNAFDTVSTAGAPWDTISWSSVNSDIDIRPTLPTGDRNARVVRWLCAMKRSATGSNSSLSLAPQHEKLDQ